MNKLFLSLILSFLGSCLIINTTTAQEADKTLSPYFKIISKSSTTEQMPLKSNTVTVNIAGVIADVQIDQVYENTGSEAIEAIYVFPASTKAAVYGMEMKIGDRIIKAKVQEKGKAKATYEQAKQEGKRASLLEQDRPNIFSMNVANILPGDKITISLKYTESIVPEEGVYEFVYPTVVGPRYHKEPISQGQMRTVGYTKERELPYYDFNIALNVQAGMPIQNIACNTHNTIITYNGLQGANVLLDPTEHKGGNRDFVLRYQLAGKKISSGLLLYEGAEENHFMWTVQPPKKVVKSDIPQREYIFVVDVSGSMNGFPLDVTKKLMRNLMGNLNYNDMFNLVLFASNANMYATESVYAHPKEVEAAINMLSDRSGSGGTYLMDALRKVTNLPKCEGGLSRSVVVITDGFISVEKDVYDLIQKNNNEFNFYSFGIGSSINRSLIEGIAHVGNSEPLFVLNKEEAFIKADKFRQFIAAPVLTNINIDWGDFDVYDLEPSAISDVLAERPVVVTGKYRGKPTGKIQLTGVSGIEDYTAIYEVENTKPSAENKSVQYLWARNKIRLLDDYNKLSVEDKRVAAITQLGLKYNLLTNYTSFVAVDQIKALAANSVTEKVKQILPLPEGVNNNAINTVNTLANHYQSGLGAALKISNAGTKEIGEIQYEVINHDLSPLDTKFLEMELQKKITQLIEAFDTDIVTGLTLNLAIDTRGYIAKIELVDTELPEQAIRELKQLIGSWTFLFHKEEMTYFTLTIIV